MNVLNKYLLETSFGEVTVYIKDNKATNTVLFIHGFNSSHAFAEKIYGMNNNFNIVTFDYPRFDIHFEKLVNIADEITKKLLKGNNFYYLGHSLGGAIALSVKNTERIAGRILVSPLNPSLVKAPGYSRLEKTLKPIGAFQKVSAKLVKKGAEIIAKHTDTPVIAEFVNDESIYKEVMDHTILNREFLEKDLLNKYIENPAYYLIGSQDAIIPTLLFTDFIKNDLKRELTIIDNSRHNPFKDNPEAMFKALNNIVVFKKRWFFIRFYTSKNLVKK